jgi:hypothetical protein
MIHFHPLDVGFAFDGFRSDLASFNWQACAADFFVPDDDERLLRISFEGDVIIRILDEFPLSTESDPATWRGLVPHHFAYRVEGAAFPEQQSSVWREMMGPINHFQFITGSGCLDVLTAGEPTFKLISAAR